MGSSICFCAFIELVPLDSKEELYAVCEKLKEVGAWKCWGGRGFSFFSRTKADLMDKAQGLYPQYVAQFSAPPQTDYTASDTV